MLIHECKPEFQFKKSSKNVKFGQCLYLVGHLCYEQNRCAERTVTSLEVVSANRGKLYKVILQSKSAHKYNEIDTGKKCELSKKNALKYKEMDQDKKNELSKKNSHKYKNMDSL